MKRKLISSLALAGTLAFGAQAEEFTGSLYIEDATIAPGGTTRLSIQLENNIEVRGFQLTMTLPQGIKYESWGISDERLSDGLTPADNMGTAGFNNQVLTVAATLNSATIQQPSFSGNAGEIAYIVISADANAAEGSYTIEMTELDVNNPIGTDYDVASTSFTLTVEAPHYAEGYTVEVLPFALNEDKVDGDNLVYIPISMENRTDIKSFGFDLQLPSSFVVADGVYVDGFAFTLTGFKTTIEEPSPDGVISVSATRNRSNKISSGTTDIAELTLYYEPGIVPTGIYPVTIRNITLTDVDDNTYMAAPYTTEIFVGESPKATAADGAVAFHGNYGEAEGFALLKAALPAGTTVDLTETSALAEDVTTLRTDNVFVTAETISYGRTMTNEWGTLCLPFALESTDDFQLYELTGVSESAMTFDKVASAEANTPLAFKTTGGGFAVSVANDGSFDAGFAAANASFSAPAADSWEWNGSYIDETVDVSQMQAYALMSNEFHRITKTLNVKAFRAWLQNNGTPLNAPAIRISEDTEGIRLVEQEDGSAKLIFDLQGRLLSAPSAGQVVVEQGKKRFSINN